MKQVIIIVLSSLANLAIGQVILDPLPDQTIGREGVFSNIVLDNYTANEVFWEVEFVQPSTKDVNPGWQVNSSQFQFEMNITAAVYSKGSLALGGDHLLSVVDGQGTVRSVGSGTEFQDHWIYFLTVYSNTNGEELYFKFFDNAIEQILNGKQSFEFKSNDILGQPDVPYEVIVSNISYILNDGLLSFEIDDPNFIGTEKLAVTARSLSDPADLAMDTIDLTVKDDYTPVLLSIPDQLSNFNEAFEGFDLDDFTTLKDGDEVTYSFDGQLELQVDIDLNHVVTITKPQNWSGAETIIITVTDQSVNAFSSSTTVTFTGKPEDQAPVIADIANQTTGVGGFFESINLSEFVTAGNVEAIKWQVDFITDSVVSAPDWSVNANEFQFNMSMTSTVKSLGERLEGANHKLAAYSATEQKMVGETEAIEVEGGWFFFLTINSNTDKDSIYFLSLIHI